MEANLNAMSSLYSQLTAFGLPKGYVRSKILPSWWDDEAAKDPAGFAEAAMLVARHVGVDLKALLSDGTVVPSTGTRAFRFKKDKDTTEASLVVARQLAAQVGRLVTEGVPAAKPLPLSGGAIRQQILDAGAPWVDLAALLDYCWLHGVPVAHVCEFPKTARKMAGLSAKADGRSAIVLSLGKKSPAWLEFVLAHELGHIVLGHLEDQDVMVDEKMDRASTENLESAANRFAIELLCGDPDTAFHPVGRWPNADQLAQAAMTHGRQRQIDPGHIVLNYAYTMGGSFYGVANAALAKLEEGRNGQDLIREKMNDNLDWSSIPADSSEFLSRMTGAGVSPRAD